MKIGRVKTLARKLALDAIQDRNFKSKQSNKVNIIDDLVEEISKKVLTELDTKIGKSRRFYSNKIIINECRIVINSKKSEILGDNEREFI